jgi:NhaP-type Na+/H+ or K+/H+ antiporter
MTVYRALVMFGVLPLFSKSQYGYTWRDALVITCVVTLDPAPRRPGSAPLLYPLNPHHRWGGLRGAVGLALAVAVARNDAIVDCNKVDAGSSGSSGSSSDGGAEPACSFAGSDDFRQIVLFHTCLTVALTLLVNAPTTGALLRAIGLTKLAPEKARRDHIQPRIERPTPKLCALCR